MLFTSQKSKAASKPNLKSGFTLFEMLITLAIVSIISGVVFYNHRQFESDTEVTNLAYQLALSVREAQNKSISVRQYGEGSESFNVPYGVHFNINEPNSFILFADSMSDSDGTGGSNGLYTFPGTDDMMCSTVAPTECVEKVTIGRGNTIKGWCGLWGNWGQYGVTTPVEPDCVFATDDGAEYIDIMFRRPNPDAFFKVYAEDDYDEGDEIVRFCDNGVSLCSGWAICLLSPQGREKRVVVYETGQISVQNVEPGGVCSG